MSVEQRNLHAKSFVLSMLDSAACDPLDTTFLKRYQHAEEILERVIRVKQNGFRGLVLTIIVGIHLDENYDPQSNFYDCNPRSIFEKGIYYALAERNIPCGKSDPLNVAKNAQQLDAAWAKGRRPESAAMGVVEFIDLLVKSRKTAAYADLVRLFFKRLLEYAEFVNSLNAPFEPPATSFMSSAIAMRLAAFTTDCAEGGALPQFLVGLLLSKLREGNDNYREVAGWRESVFGTNTTSKKPADIWEVYADGSYGKLYEVTVKVIDSKRLDDCIDSARKQETAGNEILFICDLPNNTRSLQIEGGQLIYNGIQFQFLDIREFVRITFAVLTQKQQQEVMLDLQKFIFDSSRAVSTKNYWASNFAKQ